MLHVTGFLHYLYIAAPISFTPHDCEGFKAYLETSIAMHQPVIHSVGLVMRENLYGFSGNQQNPYIKITVTDPKHINKVRSSLETANLNWKGMWKSADGILTFDSIQYVLRFMIDCHVGYSLGSWVHILIRSRLRACLGSRLQLKITTWSRRTNDTQIVK